MTLNYRAVLTGVVIDLVGSIVASVLFLTIYANALSAGGATDEEVKNLLSNPAESLEFILIVVVIGIFFDGLAGYITAKKAGYLEYWHVLAMLGLLVVIQLAMGGGSAFPVLVMALSYIGGGSAAFYGAWLVKRDRIGKT